MDSGNRTLNLKIPDELILLSDLYKKDRKLRSRNQAIVELLETHPRLIDIMVRLGYASIKAEGHSTGG